MKKKFESPNASFLFFCFGVLLMVSSLLSLAGWGTVRVVNNILFNIRCEGRITRAAQANTVELAKEELEVVVKYLEENGHTSGYTSIIYQTPDEDVGFWYTNLKSSLEELRHVKTDATQLEKSNLLIKLRESLHTHGDKGSSHAVIPPGITVHPNNLGYAVWAFLSGFLAVVGGLMCGVIVKLATD